MATMVLVIQIGSDICRLVSTSSLTVQSFGIPAIEDASFHFGGGWGFDFSHGYTFLCSQFRSRSILFEAYVFLFFHH